MNKRDLPELRLWEVIGEVVMDTGHVCQKTVTVAAVYEWDACDMAAKAWETVGWKVLADLRAEKVGK